eukprot:gene17681-21064_t
MVFGLGRLFARKDRGGGECVICCETFGSSAELFTIGCGQSHRICVECLRRYVEGTVRGEKKVATCPLCIEAAYELSEAELRLLFPEDLALVQLHGEIQFRAEMASSPNFLACPTAGCDAYMEKAETRVRQKVQCPSCEAEFCSECKETYHYQLQCCQVQPAAGRWFKWLKEDRAECRRRISEARLSPVVRFSLRASRWARRVTHRSNENTEQRAVANTEAHKEVESVMRRFAELQKDEAWKEKNCRLCEYCDRVVEKMDGCNTVTCGRDARDKGGGNAQD